MLLPQSELEAQVERMVQERLDRMKKDREDRESFTAERRGCPPRLGREEQRLVMNVSMTTRPAQTSGSCMIMMCRKIDEKSKH